MNDSEKTTAPQEPAQRTEALTPNEEIAVMIERLERMRVKLFAADAPEKNAVSRALLSFAIDLLRKIKIRIHQP